MADLYLIWTIFGRMDAASRFARLADRVEGLRELLRRIPRSRLIREWSSLAFEEVVASCALAGARLDEHELRALVERGIAAGEHRFRDYTIAAGYADAARSVAAAEPRRNRPFIRTDEIVELHARATRFQPEARSGAWRTTTAETLQSGVVPPPFWLVPREIAAFVTRFAPGPRPDTSPILYVAEAHERFARIHPFEAGNGRVDRLLANLLLRRLGLPPFIVRRRDAVRYRAALARADARDLWPLALVIARSVLEGLLRLTADGELRPLASFARGPEREALYKAAQRNRLQTVRRGATILTNEAWIADYRGSRGKRGRPARTR